MFLMRSICFALGWFCLAMIWCNVVVNWLLAYVFEGQRKPIFRLTLWASCNYFVIAEKSLSLAPNISSLTLLVQFEYCKRKPSTFPSGKWRWEPTSLAGIQNPLALGMHSLLVVRLPGCLWATVLNKRLAKDNSPCLIVAAYHFEALPLKAELVYIHLVIMKLLMSASYTVNKQLADKERVAAALENTHLLEVVNQCLAVRH